MFDGGRTFTWDRDAHSYQRHGCEHLLDHHAAMLWLSPGYGKTAITLHAFKRLLDSGQAKNMLVVAPLRVAQTVWAQEIERWASLHGLRACLLHGAKKETWLKRRDVNVWLINYEGLQWLRQMLDKKKIESPFDVVVFDEVRRMKSSTGMRFRAVKPIAALAKWRWGLTGTPASNGLMDLFGQFLIVDGGAALGTRITRFRYEFFEKGYDGFSWEPRPGAREAVEARIADMVFRADGMLDLPDFVYDPRKIVLDDKARALYNRMKDDLLTQIEGTTITAANAAVLVGKLKQMSNGRVYDEKREIIKVHAAKQDALRELVEEMGDEQLLIAYDYHHDLDQIREVLGDDIPYLGAGVNGATAMEHVERWNRKEIQFLAANPASAGHGLNLQRSGAHHILWWGPTFDLDHYIQFNDRIRRQGNTAAAVVVHTFITEKSVDEVALKAQTDKASLQDSLLAALTSVYGDDIKVDTGEKETNTMADLQFKSDAAQQANPFAQQAQQPQQANPFAQQAPAQANTPPAQSADMFAGQPAPQANPFAAQPAAPQPQANPFAGQPQQQPTQEAAPQFNPFAQAAPSPEQVMQQAQQAQAIQQDVAAPPPPGPQEAPQFNPFAGNATVEDAQVVPEPPLQAPAPPQAVSFADASPAEAPAGAPADPTVQAVAGTVVPPGFSPLYILIPAEKMAAVMAALGRALK